MNTGNNGSCDNDEDGDSQEDGRLSEVDNTLQQPVIGLYNQGLERDSKWCQTLFNICRRPTPTTTYNSNYYYYYYYTRLMAMFKDNLDKPAPDM